MKKKYVICGIITVIVLAVIVICFWYFSPVTFLKDVRKNEVASITVFSGSTGKQMILEDREEINIIVSNIQSARMKRSGLAWNYVGFSFSLTFKDKDGNVIDGITINSKNTVRDNDFFYKCESGELCFSYLLELEDKYCVG